MRQRFSGAVADDSGDRASCAEAEPTVTSLELEDLSRPVNLRVIGSRRESPAACSPRIRRNYPFAVREAADGAAQPQPYGQIMLTEIIIGADGTPQARDARNLTEVLASAPGAARGLRDLALRYPAALIAGAATTTAG